MAAFSRNQLNALLQTESDPSASLFMPTVTAGREVRQNSIRFKNLLNEVEEQLRERGALQRVREPLEAARQLIDDDPFWQHQAQGLALFLSEAGLQLYRLPKEFAEVAVVDERFHVTPLLSLLQTGGLFYVLTLSENDVRLFSADRDRIAEVAADMPDSLKAFTAGDVEHKGFHMHSFRVRRRGLDTAVPHGHVEADQHEELLQYAREIDEGVRETIDDPSAPLVVACVERLFPIYRQANSHKTLLPEAILGNPDDKTPQQLHEAAWKIVEPHITKNVDAALDRFHEAAAHQRGGSDRQEVLQAAQAGRVGVLLLTETTPAGSTALDDELEQAAVQVLMHGGEVYTVAAERLPESGLAAVYRYPDPQGVASE